MKGGFLGTAASGYADLVLLLEIGMGVGLLIGALLARLGRFRGHAWCQSVIVLLNLGVIVFTMIPSFRVHVSPKIPVKLGKAYYALATAHAALGIITEIAGLYVLLAAGTSVLPEKFRITKYKAWMRTILALWWLVLLLGFATYGRWYVPHLFRKGAGNRFQEPRLPQGSDYEKFRSRKNRDETNGPRGDDLGLLLPASAWSNN